MLKDYTGLQSAKPSSCIMLCFVNKTYSITVKADGVKTDCASTNGNCPAHATCATTVCNCDAGWLHDGSGLCTGKKKNVLCQTEAVTRVVWTHELYMKRTFGEFRFITK